MRSSLSFAATETASRSSQPARERNIPEGSALLDWTNLDAAPEVPGISTLAAGSNGGRIAVLVNSPKILRAATVFAEQAGLQGTLARVFVDATEALVWLNKGTTTRPHS